MVKIRHHRPQLPYARGEMTDEQRDDTSETPPETDSPVTDPIAEADQIPEFAAADATAEESVPTKAPSLITEDLLIRVMPKSAEQLIREHRRSVMAGIAALAVVVLVVIVGIAVSLTGGSSQDTTPGGGGGSAADKPQKAIADKEAVPSSLGGANNATAQYLNEVIRTLHAIAADGCVPAGEQAVAQLTDKLKDGPGFYVSTDENIRIITGAKAEQVGVYSDGSCTWYIQTANGKGAVLFFRERPSGDVITYETNIVLERDNVPGTPKTPPAPAETQPVTTDPGASTMESTATTPAETQPTQTEAAPAETMPVETQPAATTTAP